MGPEPLLTAFFQWTLYAYSGASPADLCRGQVPAFEASGELEDLYTGDVQRWLGVDNHQDSDGREDMV